MSRPYLIGFVPGVAVFFRAPQGAGSLSFFSSPRRASLAVPAGRNAPSAASRAGRTRSAAGRLRWRSVWRSSAGAELIRRPHRTLKRLRSGGANRAAMAAAERHLQAARIRFMDWFALQDEEVCEYWLGVARIDRAEAVP